MCNRNITPTDDFINEDTDNFNLDRFVTAQDRNYDQALQEIENGRKRSHWIWYIFPQMVGLGFSYHSRFYGISGYDEAEAYLNHPILGENLRRITEALLTHSDKSAVDILGGIDAMKVCSCMTLFDAVSPGDIFEEVLNVFYDGISDSRTLELL